MKRTITIFILLVTVLLGFSGCGSSDKSGGAKEDTSKPKLKIVATIFPEYSWTKELLGSHEKDVELTILAKKGVDMHSYQPSAEDILRIANCDLFLYVGGESDKWVDKALKEGGNPKRRVLNLMKLMGDRAKVEEEVEGMEKHDHHEHDKEANAHPKKDKQDEKHEHHDKDKHEEKHEHEKEHDTVKHDVKVHHEQPEYDEHVWLSLKNADIVCKAIAEELAALDSKNAETYRANYTAYSKKMAALDAKYKEAVTKAPVKTVLFGDRFPFRYLTDDYGLQYYAAFNGCSAETEASFATVAFLAKKMDELKLPAVLTIEGRQHKLAQTIVENTKAKNQKVLTLNSMQSVTEEEIKKGITYLAVMEQNLNVFKEALQAK
ncbi:MAG: zinc ABC transporter substrate-binding protein [Acidaminococcaceae bacterium]|nr:zinc ABC transporter substrate-binding protein [Acidaminococcaceae bacterium]